MLCPSIDGDDLYNVSFLPTELKFLKYKFKLFFIPLFVKKSTDLYSKSLGIDYKLDYIEGIGKTNIEDEKEGDKDKFLEFTLATVFRDAREKNIPTSSTIDEKSSNLFGSINNNLLENINIGYDFSLDNDLNTFESHSGLFQIIFQTLSKILKYYQIFL